MTKYQVSVPLVSYYTIEVEAIDMMQARELVEEMGPSVIADDGYYTGWDYLEFKVDYADDEEEVA